MSLPITVSQRNEVISVAEGSAPPAEGAIACLRQRSASKMLWSSGLDQPHAHQVGRFAERLVEKDGRFYCLFDKEADLVTEVETLFIERNLVVGYLFKKAGAEPVEKQMSFENFPELSVQRD